MAITRQGLTLEQFLKLPEREPALEYADGVVTQKVAPKARHSRLQYKLAEWFNRWAEPRRLAFAFPELRTTYSGRSYVPDIAVYRRERISRNAKGEPEDEVFEPPDIAVEIVSPGQGIPALILKCRWYVEHGVLIALLVNPDDYSVRRFEPGRELLLRGADVIDMDAVLPGLHATADEWFAMLRPGW